MDRPEMYVVCPECKQDHMVTDIDIVNGMISYIVDDLRCNLKYASLDTIKELKIKQTNEIMILY